MEANSIVIHYGKAKLEVEAQLNRNRILPHTPRRSGVFHTEAKSNVRWRHRKSSQSNIG